VKMLKTILRASFRRNSATNFRKLRAWRHIRKQSTWLIDDEWRFDGKERRRARRV
jgi:hypothetical protein